MVNKDKYLWVFIPRWGGGEPFPLFWSDKNIGCADFEDLTEDEQNKIKYLFSDNEYNRDPNDGYIIAWSHLHLLPYESSLSEVSK